MEKETKNVKKIIRNILIVIIILIILFLIHTIRNYIIITNLQNKVEEYIQSENYHITSISNLDDNVTLTTNYYKKVDKELITIDREKDSETIKISMYNNGERIDRFFESPDSKTVTLNVAKSMNVSIVDYLKTDNNWQSFIYSIPTMITSVEYNGKKCYKITNFLSPYYLYDSKHNELYIEKETGLCLLNYTGTENKYDYEFNNVDDSIFIEPNIGQYTLEENP